MFQITTVVGSQWGDEGKGKITDYFAGSADYVVRYNGGNNAGHTVIVGDQVFKLHLLPSGVVSPRAICVIGNGVVVDPKVLLEEIDDLKSKGINLKLKISQRAHLIMPYHIAMNLALEGHQNELAAGSTNRGIAPAYADKAYRHGMRVGDLLEPEIFKQKLEKAFQFNADILTQVFQFKFEKTVEQIFDEYLAYGKKLEQYISDTELELYQAYKNGKTILYEGAQGMSLDLDHGLYPHGTSSNTIAEYAGVGSGVGLNCQKRIIGVTKAYVSRVGKSPFISELLDETGELIRKKGAEYGTTTGRPRRVGWLDLVQLRQAVRVNGLSELALTKLDILNDFKEIKVCVAYDVNGETVTEMPASLALMRAAKPIYQTFPGWGAPEKTDSYESLPREMKNYIEFIEKESGCPAKIISLGAERNQTILR